ncbi:MAG TPA: hypothetical protein VNM14_22710 [Planctomycetota bacterium]|nr:hypothetical protein [Planctomycetota bacterium]
MGVVAVLLSCLSFLPAPQADAAEAKKIQEAIKKGVEFLRSQEGACLVASDVVGRKMCSRELVLWTLINVGVSPKDPFYGKMFDDMMKDKLEATYPVALQAMCLEFIDRVQLQKRIAQCAKFLMDNQGPGGYWSYGSPSIYIEDIEYDNGKQVAPKGPEFKLPDVPANPKVVKKITIKKDRDGEGNDASNSYVAALGLRACSDAGIVFESRHLEQALKYWKESCQGKGPASGWAYDLRSQSTYPAVTASAVSCMLIYGNLLGVNLKKDPVVVGGAASLAKSWNGGTMFRATNRGESDLFHEYGLYAVEISQLFLGKDGAMARDWYAEGAKKLLEEQKPDGSWDSSAKIVRIGGGQVGQAVYTSTPIWDTCFAVLFLTKGIKPLEFAPAKKK